MRPNLLIDPLPETVAVGGARVPIRTDFRIGMLFELMMWDERVAPRDKVAQTLRLYFEEAALPGDLDAAYRAALWFFRGGEPAPAQGDGPAEGPARRLYCFDADAPLLYAAFRAQYRIDLQAASLHWWAFRALFQGLTAEHELSRRMAIRATSLSSAPSKEERARLARLKARYRIGGGASMADKAGAVFGGGGDAFFSF